MSPWKAREPNTNPQHLLTIMERLRDLTNDCASRVKESHVLKGTYLTQAAEYEAIAQIIRDRIGDGQKTQTLAEALAPPPRFLQRGREPNPVSIQPELARSDGKVELVGNPKSSSSLSDKFTKLFGTSFHKEKSH